MMVIKLLAMDVDGTMTDGSINIGPNGEIYKKFNVKDGYGIKLAIEFGITPAIITGRQSSIVENRAKELKISEVHQNVTDKCAVLKELIKKYGLTSENIAYVGDDINDIAAINMAGHSFCPSDAVEEVKKIADTILQTKGGEGAIRECIDIILKMEDSQ